MSTSVVRAMRILDLLAHADEAMTLTEIAEKLDIPKSTAFGILRDMANESFVSLPKPATYTIGLKAFEVGSAHLRRVGVTGIVTPELSRLTRALGVTSHYAILDRTDAVYLCKQDPPGLGIRLASSVGARLPSHLTAVGKACLAWLAEERLPEHIELTAPDDTGMANPLQQLTAELTEIRQRGFAADNGQITPGVTCVAAPVFNPAGCQGAVGVSYLRDTAVDFDTLVTQVREAAGRTSALLGAAPA
ncbi:IclR family transcriptional regulator [Streptomyces sp. NPDC056112]|uniref:IclR family transcriptional regulator n=1 Tax=unclassified Streptomyces TaxID=2593676 RepID=UPI001CD24A6F|nr:MULTISPECIES: IclR family transcriptional regulator [unclassified Streptomyces]